MNDKKVICVCRKADREGDSEIESGGGGSLAEPKTCFGAA